jgi:hypothetical protein
VDVCVVLGVKRRRKGVREMRVIKREKMVHKVDRGEVETYRETTMLSSDCGGAAASVSSSLAAVVGF